MKIKLIKEVHKKPNSDLEFTTYKMSINPFQKLYVRTKVLLNRLHRYLSNESVDDVIKKCYQKQEDKHVKIEEILNSIDKKIFNNTLTEDSINQTADELGKMGINRESLEFYINSIQTEKFMLDNHLHDFKETFKKEIC